MSDFVAAWILIVIFIAAALFFFLMGKKMMAGKLHPNPLIGIRVPASFRSKEDWHSIQSACAWHVMLLSFILLDSAILFFILEVVVTGVSFVIPTVISAGQIAVVITLIVRTATKQGR